MKDIVEYIVKSLCDYPEEVSIKEESGHIASINFLLVSLSFISQTLTRYPKRGIS